MELQTLKLVGTWELYRTEALESIIDEWTGTEWTTKDKWFTNNPTDAGIHRTFKNDGTLEAKYVDVVFNSGKWTRIEENKFMIAFDAKKSGTAGRDK